MSDASLVSAVVGAGIGVLGTLAGTLLALAVAGRREARGTALGTAEFVTSLQQHIWSTSATDGSELVAKLRRAEVHLRAAGVKPFFREAFVRVTFTCWREATTVGPDNTPRIAQDLLSLAQDIENVVLEDVLRDEHWWKRRRARRQVAARLAERTLVGPPSSSTAVP